MRIGAIQNDKIDELIYSIENDRYLTRKLMEHFRAFKMQAKKGSYNKEKAIKKMESFYQNYARPLYMPFSGIDIKLNRESRKAFGKYFIDIFEEEYGIKK